MAKSLISAVREECDPEWNRAGEAVAQLLTDQYLSP
jgi:hypothetical protein